MGGLKIIIICLCLMLLIGLRDGRIAKVDGNPQIQFALVDKDGETTPCVVIITGTDVYAIPIVWVKTLTFMPDNTVM